ncbi:hypothetical protein E1A91_D11G159000v1 [Gossypium mustelinum]|uniref:dCTP pyrophosphatase 1 n=2 Tax=Gossypium mustelinum TaxID=34275 RepID=A0A5D2SS37_GOSMU|nr:hypothetical protein E1A91_D11G159000v1 [Gossypium mustelinum]
MTGGVEERDQSVSLDLLKQKMANFAKERDWDQFHSPRNLLLALVGEVGELSEIFQWKGEVPKGLPDWKEEEKVHLGEELSDVLLYLVRLSDICGIDLGKAALRKVELNAVKYPASKKNFNTSNGTAHTGTTAVERTKTVVHPFNVQSVAAPKPI